MHIITRATITSTCQIIDKAVKESSNPRAKTICALIDGITNLAAPQGPIV